MAHHRTLKNSYSSMYVLPPSVLVLSKLTGITDLLSARGM